MSKLVKLLEYYNAPISERKKMIDKNHFKLEVGEKTAKELLLTEAEETDEMVKTEVLKTIIIGARYKANLRKVLPVVMIDKPFYQARAITQGNQSYAAEIPEGGIIPEGQGSYSSTTVTSKKIGTRPSITQDMIEDCEYEAVEIELKAAGMRLENKMNSIILNSMISNCTNTGTDAEISADSVIDALDTIQDAGFMADKIVLHPKAQSHLFGGISEFNRSVDLSNRGEGKAFPFGLQYYNAHIGLPDDSSYEWDSTDNTNHYYAIILDSMSYGRILMKREMKVKEYDDPLHDLHDLCITRRFGVGITNKTAAVRFLTN